MTKRKISSKAKSSTLADDPLTRVVDETVGIKNTQHKKAKANKKIAKKLQTVKKAKIKKAQNKKAQTKGINKIKSSVNDAGEKAATLQAELKLDSVLVISDAKNLYTK